MFLFKTSFIFSLHITCLILAVTNFAGHLKFIPLISQYERKSSNRKQNFVPRVPTRLEELLSMLTYMSFMKKRNKHVRSNALYILTEMLSTAKAIILDKYVNVYCSLHQPERLYINALIASNLR